MVQFGQYAPPRHRIVHVSDTHFLGGSRPLYGAVDTDDNLARALHQLERSGVRPEAIVVTGDLADLGEVDAYRRLRAELDPVAERLGAEIVWVMGNHDEREPFAAELWGETSDGRPLDRVYDVGGLRIVALDSTVPGFHHGALDDAQLDWLRDVLATPAPDGTLLALHHPPVPSPVEIMAILELERQDRLADVIRGTDVRGILGGHLHYSTHGTFAGVPVAVAAATCYTIDVSAPVGTLLGVDAGQSINLVDVYDEIVLHSIVPVNSGPQVSGFSDAVLDRLAALGPEERRAAFSDKSSTYNLAEAASSD
jgi:Icc protein